MSLWGGGDTPKTVPTPKESGPRLINKCIHSSFIGLARLAVDMDIHGYGHA